MFENLLPQLVQERYRQLLREAEIERMLLLREEEIEQIPQANELKKKNPRRLADGLGDLLIALGYKLKGSEPKNFLPP